MTPLSMNPLLRQLAIGLAVLLLHSQTLSRSLVDASEQNAKLFVFAGPQKTSETSIEEFFHAFAQAPGSPGYSDNDEQKALHAWIWPHIQDPSDNPGLITGLGNPSSIFGHLVTDSIITNNQEAGDQEEVLNTILDGIAKDFETVLNDPEMKGVIIGSGLFDQVGPSPYFDYDAIGAIRRVVNKVKVDPKDVTILLLYRIPRVDQWLGLFNFVPLELEPGWEREAYKEFLCSDSYTPVVYNALHSSMSPLWLARKYEAQGFVVKLMDMSGVEELGQDIEHAIGCSELEAECPRGDLIYIEDRSFLSDSAAQDSMTNEQAFSALTTQQQDELEQLFLLRDCVYKYMIEPASDIVFAYPYKMLQNCQEGSRDLYEKLAETPFFLNVLRSQVGCNTEPVSIAELLGTAPEMTSSDNGDDSPAWIVPVFLLVFVGAAALGVIWVRRSDVRIQGEYEGATPNIQLQTQQQNQNSHLSMLT